VKVWLHSTGDASSLAALLLPQIFPICLTTLNAEAARQSAATRVDRGPRLP
jgi:hypothetical protein